MSYTKPFPRIFLPQMSVGFDMDDTQFTSDSRYVNSGEVDSLVNAARIIIKDFQTLVDYIEPSDQNKDTYSHRTYELLLRVATEFEANCKGVLMANGYVAHGNMNIQDYHKINKVMKLDKYEIESHLWNPSKCIKPLEEWENGHTISWYQAYNLAKHNRYSNFHEATIERVYQGICSLIVILAAQFPASVAYIGNGFTSIPNEDNEIIVDNFVIKYPTFADQESYDFDWETLSSDVNAFEKYHF